jgi:hypothetical protein
MFTIVSLLWSRLRAWYTSPPYKPASRLCLRFCFPILLVILALPAGAFARGSLPVSHAQQAPVGLSLAASPKLVDVGDPVVLTVSARKWNGPAAASASFVSPHHGFSGAMQWKVSCGCFQAPVILAKRIHPLETAKATAKVTARGKTFVLTISFTVRGLARNGKDYARGGQIFLMSWVGDPTPAVHQDEHICAWVLTADGLGVPGYRIHYTVHYPKTIQSWYSRATGRSGVACSQRKVLPVTSKQTIHIDAAVAKLKSSTGFTVTP